MNFLKALSGALAFFGKLLRKPTAQPVRLAEPIQLGQLRLNHWDILLKLHLLQLRLGMQPSSKKCLMCAWAYPSPDGFYCALTEQRQVIPDPLDHCVEWREWPDDHTERIHLEVSFLGLWPAGSGDAAKTITDRSHFLLSPGDEKKGGRK